MFNTQPQFQPFNNPVPPTLTAASHSVAGIDHSSGILQPPASLKTALSQPFALFSSEALSTQTLRMLSEKHGIHGPESISPAEWISVLDKMLVVENLADLCQTESWLIVRFGDSIAELISSRIRHYFPVFFDSQAASVRAVDAHLVGQLACNAFSNALLARKLLHQDGLLGGLLKRLVDQQQAQQYADQLAFNAALQHYRLNELTFNDRDSDYIIEFVDWLYSRITGSGKADKRLALSMLLILSAKHADAAVEYCKLLDSESHSLLSAVEDAEIRRDLQLILFE
jgi:hypothetical protein